MPHITTICQVRFPKLEKRLANAFQKSMFIASFEICGAMTKKETSATAPITVTKVSSEHMTSGISAVLTLPCSAPIRWSALYSLLSNSIKPEYAKPVKKCAGLFAES